MKFTDEDRLVPFSPVIAQLLASGLRVLVYYGDKDLVLPWNGGLQWMWQMNWSGQANFQKSPPIFWRAPGVHHDAGVAKVYDNLWWTTILNAGHMSPHDKPQETLQMMRLFLNNTPFTPRA
jgi:cathepsin A (carboxypeptidase C)